MKKRIGLLIAVVFLFSQSCREKTTEYQAYEGEVFGTFYHIVYQYFGEEELMDAISKKWQEFDLSLSVYNPKSVISKVNRNDTSVVLDSYFMHCFHESKKISEATKGAFDWTIAPLVNAWGFGFANQLEPENIPVDSLLQLVGNQKVSLKNGRVYKENPNIMFDASAIAKGYAVDVVANFLESKQVKNYMVEIGGELRVKGKSPKNRPWRVGIDKPTEESGILSGQVQDIFEINEVALATSGNYRQFYLKNGKKYAHTINPETGYPVQHNLLSASVMASSCIVADAYATAFMVLGLEKSVELVQQNSSLDAYFIYSDENGNLKTFVTPRLKKKILP